MNPNPSKSIGFRKGSLYWLYVLIIGFIVLSGFAQMPIFKRYYIADIPGLGWLAQYYVTHVIHYIAAALLIALVFYRASEYFLSARFDVRLTLSGYLRGGLIVGLIISGVLLVIRNLAGQNFSPLIIIYLDLIHIVFMLLFLFALLFSALFKKKWTKPIS
ncbi:MAG: hypothetical protein AB1585_01255 [Thermodesulfobacteriota bacterium]